MKFRNKVTGIVVDIPSIAKGDWEPVKVPAPSVKAKEIEPKVEDEKPVKKTRKVSK